MDWTDGVVLESKAGEGAVAEEVWVVEVELWLPEN
jgi:hypothetical protein